ncbi:MAG: AAA family ATPase [Leptospirillia bacterium]
MPIVAELRRLEGDLNRSLKEREEVVRAVVLALLSGEHLYLVGPPGTGKSLVIRLAAKRFSCLSYYERLLHMESDRAALSSSPLSPLGIADGSLVFLDEVLRAPKSLLLTLLGFMNERVWHDPSPTPAALLSLFAASNAHPSQGDNLEAFFDRFALRCLVEPVRKFESFVDLLESPPVGETKERCAAFSQEDFRSLHRHVSTAVPIGSGVIEALWELRYRLGREGISLSDRRWKMVLKILRAVALYEGAGEVSIAHLPGILPVLWTYPPEIRTIRRILAGMSS